MKIQFESVHFTANQKLLDHMTKKLEKLGQFHNRIISCNVTLKQGAAKTVKDKIVEVNIAIPGDVIFAKKVDTSFEAAVDDLVGSLRRQLIKKKEMERAH